MEIIIVLLVVGGLVWHSRARYAEEQRSRKQHEQNRLQWEQGRIDEEIDEEVAIIQAEYDRELEERELVAALVAEAVTNHFEVLNRKYKQGIVTDEYGITRKDAAYAEIMAFAKRVCDPRVYQWYKNKQEPLVPDWVLELETDIEMALFEDPRFQWEDEPNSPYSSGMTGREYEDYVANIIRASGAAVGTTPVTGDQGVDLRFSQGIRRVAVQCKRSSTTVGNSAVQQAHSGMLFYGDNEAWVVSDAEYTRSARQLAGQLGVRLLHHEQIAEEL
jgi:restriction system protein